MPKISQLKKEEPDNTGGSIEIGIDPALRVVMNFDKMVPGITFTPEQAEAIGVSLIQQAAVAKLRGGAAQRVVSARTH